MGRRAADLHGRVFGRLTTLGRLVSDAQNKAVWACRCECGNFAAVRAHDLKNGTTSSCGCGMGFRHGLTHSREWRSWKGMKDRCSNRSGYRDRGIHVCDEWADNFMAFRAYLIETIGLHPGEGYSLDRIDNDADYEPGNIRWATYSEQQRNKNSFKWRSTANHISNWPTVRAARGRVARTA